MKKYCDICGYEIVEAWDVITWYPGKIICNCKRKGNE